MTWHKPCLLYTSDDIRAKLLELGVPENEIAFIHNAKSEVQKKDLFGKVRSGQVRILLGSTCLLYTSRCV